MCEGSFLPSSFGPHQKHTEFESSLRSYPINRTSPAFRVEDLGPDSLFGIFKMNIERISEKESTIEIHERNIGQYT